MNKILNIFHNLTQKINKRIKPKAIAVMLVALVVSGFAFSGIAQAKNDSFESNLSLDKESVDLLKVSAKTTQIKPGLSRADVDKLNNEHDVQAIKAYIQELGDKYGIDWKLVYAIGVYESGNYSSYLAQNNNNFFGRKATSSSWMQFDTAQEGIDNQFQYLKRNYIDKGLDTPAEMNRIYCEGDTWKYKVQFIMDNA